MRFLPRLLTLSLLLFPFLDVSAQEEGLIFLRNPSFEDMPRNSSPPRGWTNCGFPGESPPDVHPDPQFEFRVSKPAQHETTYLGMVTRENETYESVGQQMAQPFSSEQCYSFRIFLARSPVYLSRSRKTNQPSNYIQPIKLRVYGGYSVCDRRQLLGESDLVRNTDWQEYRFKLHPEQDFTHIVLEAYYKQPIMFPYNGNLLLDNAQPLRPIPCDEAPWFPANDMLVTMTNPEDDIQPKPVRPVYRPTPPMNEPTGQVVPKEPTVRLGKTEAILKEGTVFSIEKITFKANSAELEEKSEEALEEIVEFLKENDNVIVEIGGHASNMATTFTANELSTNRARSVVSYLHNRDIGFERLLPHGYGKTLPVCKEKNQECNRKNQRVEVKILKVKS
ncbi:MAG: outer membrane protein OmpA-like peptidoglycan-associated protein [Neolewinella sp.]|jgi:outer membrane protein OmpA-like peptidoglycan-associated protein